MSRDGTDPTEIEHKSGCEPETTFEVGIVKTIKWYLDNKKWMVHNTSDEYQKYYEKMYE